MKREDYPRYTTEAVRSGFAWPQHAWNCYPDEIERTLQEMREAHRQAWLDYADAWAFLKDHFPPVNIVKECRTSYDIAHPNDADGKVRVILRECGLAPYCLACTNRMNGRNANSLVGDIKNRYTPPDMPTQFFSGAFSCRESARLDGWGMSARERIADLKDTVRSWCRDAFGEGFGASICYHDIGENGFIKPNPHVDIIVNGYALHEGKSPVELQPLDYSKGGKERYGAIWMEHVVRKFPLAEKTQWDFLLTPNRDADTNPWTTVRYHVRELCDLTRIEYDPKRQVVGWERRDKEQWHDPEMPVARFLVELRSYMRRTGGPKSTILRSRVGHFAHGIKRSVTRSFGNREPEHSDNCTCVKCAQLERRPGGGVAWSQEDREVFS